MKADTPWREPSSTAREANFGTVTAKARKTNWGRWDWWSIAVVLWNTRYLDAVLAKVRTTDVVVKPEDVQRLSPLLLDHVNVLGRYEFALTKSIRQGRLRPLREPKGDG